MASRYIRHLDHPLVFCRQSHVEASASLPVFSIPPVMQSVPGCWQAPRPGWQSDLGSPWLARLLLAVRAPGDLAGTWWRQCPHESSAALTTPPPEPLLFALL